MNPESPTHPSPNLSIRPTRPVALQFWLDITRRSKTPAEAVLRLNVISTRAFAKVIGGNTSLEDLDLSGSVIGEHSGCRLAAALKDNTSIRQLNMSRCRIGPKATEMIAQALEANTTLCSLVLEGNDLTTTEDESGVASARQVRRRGGGGGAACVQTCIKGISICAGSQSVGCTTLNTLTQTHTHYMHYTHYTHHTHITHITLHSFRPTPCAPTCHTPHSSRTCSCSPVCRTYDPAGLWRHQGTR